MGDAGSPPWGCEPPRPPAERLARVREAIAAACERAGRSPSSVTLIGASKTVGGEDLLLMIEAGLTDFGENRVQEASSKWPGLRSLRPHVRVAMIGPLQRNKVRQAVARFDSLHSVDSLRLAEEVARECERQQRRPEVFVQVDLAGEEQKSGVDVASAAGLVDRCRADLGLRVAGLMTIPPADRPPRPYFARLARLAADLGAGSLSMGMSGDYEDAVAEGSTHVRVGSALFGRRPAPAPAGVAR